MTKNAKQITKSCSPTNPKFKPCVQPWRSDAPTAGRPTKAKDRPAASPYSSDFRPLAPPASSSALRCFEKRAFCLRRAVTSSSASGMHMSLESRAFTSYSSRSCHLTLDFHFPWWLLGFCQSDSRWTSSKARINP